MTIKTVNGAAFDHCVPVLIVGADFLVLERGAVPLGTTSMSSGLIPAVGTHALRAAGTTDETSRRFAADLVKEDDHQ